MNKKRWSFYFPAKQYYAKSRGNDNKINEIQIVLESIKEDDEYDGCYFEFSIIWHCDIDAWQFNIRSDTWEYKEDFFYFFSLFKNLHPKISFVEMVRFLMKNNFKDTTKYKEEEINE